MFSRNIRVFKARSVTLPLPLPSSWSVYVLHNKIYIIKLILTNNIHGSSVTLEPMTDEVNNIDYVVAMAPAKGWHVLGNK